MAKKSATQAPLTPAVLHILLALSTGERHGYGIMKQGEADSQGKVKMGPGTLYGSMGRMMEAGLIRESDKRVDPEMDDERRGGDPNRLGDVFGAQAAGDDRRYARATLGQQTPVEALAGTAPKPFCAFVEEVEVGPKRLGRVNVGSAGHMNRLDHLDPGFASHLPTERRTLFPIQLHHRQPGVLNRLGNLIKFGIHKNAHNLTLTPKSSRNPHSFLSSTSPRTLSEVDQPDTPSSQPHSLGGVIQIRDPTDLHAHETRVREPLRLEVRVSPRGNL